VRPLVRLALTCGTVAMLAWPAAASATHDTRPNVNIAAFGHSPNPASFLEDPAGPAPAEINSDLAFWEHWVFNGNYDGFRIIDARDRSNPVELSHTRCQGNQGDIVVWENILVRSWNSPAPPNTSNLPGGFPLAQCDGQNVPAGWEGVHVFDISNKADPQLIAQVELPCGSHTATGVPDRANNRLLIYNQTSGGPCYFFDILEVPLDAPQNTRLLRQQELEGMHACHDSGVILGNVNLMACAAGEMTNVFDIGPNEFPGGTPLRPKLLYTVEEEGVGPRQGQVEHGGNWHSAAFTWDGRVLILGWEPGGGAEAECEADDPAVTKSAFFYDARTGEKLGQWTLPRPQSENENCTIHNYNIVPIRDRYIMTGGHYQAGTWVVDFTNPANPFVLASSDMPEVQPTQLAGAWSSYWYNNFIFESSITEGLNVFQLTDRALVRRTRFLDHLNPQTQEFSLPPLSARARAAAAKERRAMARAAGRSVRH